MSHAMASGGHTPLSEKKLSNSKQGGSSNSSPRCVMDEHAIASTMASTMDRSLSPVMAQEQYDRQQVRKAKIAVIKSQYKDALSIGNAYLVERMEDGWRGPLSYFQTILNLSEPLLIEDASFTFQVRFGTQLTAVDEMATIVLQAWHEIACQSLSRRPQDSTEAHRHLQPLLQLYSSHPMPIQLFVQIWIPFWHSLALVNVLSQVGPRLALAWSLQVAVWLVEQCRQRSERTPELLLELKDSLVEFIFTQQLPRLRSPELAEQMAMAILDPSHVHWEPLMQQSKDHWGTTKNTKSVRLVRNVLEEDSKLRTCESSTISQELKRRLSQNEIFRNLPQEEPLSLSSSPSQLTPSSSLFIRIPSLLMRKVDTIIPDSLRPLLQKLRQSTESVIQSLMSTNVDSDSRTRLRSQKLSWTLLVAGILLGWRHRGILRRLGKATAMALLVPITDLVEALTMKQ